MASKKHTHKEPCNNGFKTRHRFIGTMLTRSVLIEKF